MIKVTYTLPPEERDTSATRTETFNHKVVENDATLEMISEILSNLDAQGFELDINIRAKSPKN